jgi:hypothetical protein
MLRKTFIFLIAIAIAQLASAQAKSTYKGFPSLIWPRLYDVQFVKAKDQHGEYDKPIFSEAAKALNNKIVTLPGYMAPFENGMKGSHFMLTSLPLNACFFCGVGGPETVIEVYLKAPVTYNEKPIEVKGTLKLNDKDPDKMIYILENATIVGEVEL